MGLSDVRYINPKKGQGGDYIGNGFRMVQTLIFEKKRKIQKPKIENSKKRKSEKFIFFPIIRISELFLCHLVFYFGYWLKSGILVYVFHVKSGIRLCFLACVGFNLKDWVFIRVLMYYVF